MKQELKKYKLFRFNIFIILFFLGSIQLLSAQDVNNRILNVKEFGISANGSTDQSTALRNCLQFASKNNIKTLFFPAGRYIIKSPVNVTSDITIMGAGNNETKFQSENNAIFNVNTANFVVNNLDVVSNRFLVIFPKSKNITFEKTSFNKENNNLLSYVITKSPESAQLQKISITNSHFLNSSPIFLNNLIYIEDVIFENNIVKDAVNYCIRIKNNSHDENMAGFAVNRLVFKKNVINGLNSGANKNGVARLIMTNAKEIIDVQDNKIYDVVSENSANYIYWSNSSLIFKNNYCENISSATFAIHDKGDGAAKYANHDISGNHFVQKNNKYRLRSYINIHKSSNFIIANNIFENINAAAVTVSNPKPTAESFSSNISIIKNTFIRPNTTSLINLIQRVSGVKIAENIITDFSNTDDSSEFGDSSPRVVTTYVSVKNSLIDNVKIYNNSVTFTSQKHGFLLWSNNIKLAESSISNIQLFDNKGQNIKSFYFARNSGINDLLLNRNKADKATQKTLGAKPKKLLVNE